MKEGSLAKQPIAGGDVTGSSQPEAATLEVGSAAIAAGHGDVAD